MILKKFLQELIWLFRNEQKLLFKNQVICAYPQNFVFLTSFHTLPRTKTLNSRYLQYLFFICKNKKRHISRIFTKKRAVSIIKDFNNKNLVKFNTHLKEKTTFHNITTTLERRCFFNVVILTSRLFLDYQKVFNIHCLYSFKIYIVLAFSRIKHSYSVSSYYVHVIRNIVNLHNKYFSNQSFKLLIHKMRKQINHYSSCTWNIFLYRDINGNKKLSLCFFTKANKNWKIFLKV